MRKCLLFATVFALGSLATAQNVNMNWTNESRPKSCAELNVHSDEAKVARAEQKFTIAPSQAGLELNGAKNGGVRVYGWDRPEYEVIACKVAWGDSESEAQQTLAALNVTQQGTAINSTTPDGGERHWTVMYLVNVPHNAKLKASAYNGPMSVDDVDGAINVTSHNGPVHVKRCKGEITAETVNGPVAFVGKGGNVNLRTTNGPLKLELESARWDGSLNAQTQNGPLNLQVPENFESAFVLQGEHSPVRCRGAICDKVNKSGDRESKRLEFGTAPNIKGSTTNGPITIEVLRANL